MSKSRKPSKAVDKKQSADIASPGVQPGTEGVPAILTSAKGAVNDDFDVEDEGINQVDIDSTDAEFVSLVRGGLVGGKRRHYEVLGVERDAATNQIKKAFRIDAVQHHSDKGADLKAKVSGAHALLTHHRNVAASKATRELVASLACKVLIGDYNATRLSMSVAADEEWHDLLLRPRLYKTVCDLLGASELVDHNPDAALDAEDSKAQRRRACWTEFTFRGLDKWVLESDEWHPEDHGFEPAPAPAAVPHAPATVAQSAIAEGAAEATFSVYLYGAGNRRKIKVSGLKPRDTIKKLKLLALRELGIPIGAQRMVFKSQRLVDTDTLEDIGIEEGYLIDVMKEQVGC